MRLDPYILGAEVGRRVARLMRRLYVRRLSGRAASDGHDDFKCLIDQVLPIAADLIVQQGGFFPFGAAVDHSGLSSLVAVADSTGSVEARIDDLVNAYAAMTGRFRALALCRWVTFRIPVEASAADGVEIGLEHEFGAACTVVYPYSLVVTTGSKDVEWGAPHSIERQRRVF